jgi:hypothetical protein
MRAPRARPYLLAAAACAAALACAAPASADTVTDWNQNAAGVLIGDNMQGAVAVAHLAMVHGAMYDAVNAIDRRYTPYIAAPHAKRWYSQEAAAATAAYRVLVASDPPVVPPEKLQAAIDKLTPLYAASLAAIPDGRAKTRGIAVGTRAADAMIAARTNDGRFGPFRFTPGTAPGQWQPTPPGFVNDPGAWLKDVRPFLIRSATQFRSGPPNPLTSRRYAREFNEVKTLGSLTSTARTADQTQAALYWGGTNAPATWSAILRSLASADGGSLADHARMFAKVYNAGADALITVWVGKARYSSWRPVTAIRRAAEDGNDATVPDPSWTPLVTTPPYPEHPAGLPTLSATAATTLADYYGTDDVAFAVENAIGITRPYASLSQVIDEVLSARVWGGIHFRTADDEGVKIGRRVARWADRRYFLPVCRHGH